MSCISATNCRVSTPEEKILTFEPFTAPQRYKLFHGRDGRPPWKCDNGRHDSPPLSQSSVADEILALYHASVPIVYSVAPAARPQVTIADHRDADNPMGRERQIDDGADLQSFN